MWSRRSWNGSWKRHRAPHSGTWIGATRIIAARQVIAEQALSSLLQNSGLIAVPTGEREYRLLPREQGAALQLAPTAVDARSESAYGTVQGYLATRDRIRAQGAQTVSESLSYTAGVHTNVAGNNPTDSTLMLRGFHCSMAPIPMTESRATAR